MYDRRFVCGLLRVWSLEEARGIGFCEGGADGQGLLQMKSTRCTDFSLPHLTL